MDDQDPDSLNATNDIIKETKCTLSACHIESDEHNLQCVKCKRKVHYKCTLLPLYQLQRFLNFGTSYRKYICSNCVEIRGDLCAIVPKTPSNETLQLELANQQRLIKTYELELIKLREALTEYRSQDVNSSTKKRKRNQENEDINEQSEDEEEQNETPINKKDEPQQTSQHLYQEKFLAEMKSMIDKKFNQMEYKINNIVESKIQEKLHDQENMQTTFAETLTKNINEVTIEKAIQESLNKELVQDTQRMKREKNMIIHGVVENRGAEIEDMEHDEMYISDLFQIIGADVKPTTITRLGKPNEERNRPIKLVMESTEDKAQVMSRLINLKNAEQVYRSISVKDDHTYEERETIKQWMRKADQRNKKEKTTDWKVRGSPKNGLRLVKVTKKGWEV